MALATVIIATYGDDSWAQMAAGDAMASCVDQGVDVILSHEGTLAEARNRGAARARTEWLIYLDADDRLAPGYVSALMGASGDLRAPAVSYVHPSGAELPQCLAGRDIERMNPCVIGTAIRAQMFRDLGGFREWPAWEDWCLWLRAYRRGAQIVHVPSAVYLATVRPGSRNAAVTDPRGLHKAIRAAA